VMRDEVRRVSQELSEYKRPRRIQVRMEEFEKTSTQKIKRYLYELTAQEVQP
jgi:long-chain acyl-CoA synthetase